jgi:iron complex outermembrane receptor protein
MARRFGPENRAGLRINAVRRDGETAIDREERELSVFSLGADYRGRGYRVSADVGYQDHQLNNARPSVTVAAGLPMVAAPDAGSNWAQPWTVSKERDVFGTLRAEVDLGKDASPGPRSAAQGRRIERAGLGDGRCDGSATMSRFDNVREDEVRTGEIGVRGALRTGPVKHAVGHRLGLPFRVEERLRLGDFAGFATNIYRPVDVAGAADRVLPGREHGQPAGDAQDHPGERARSPTRSPLPTTRSC